MKPSEGFPRLRTVLNGALIALGLTVMGGWVLHVPSMFLLNAGSVPLVFGTGLGFALAGVASTAFGRRRPAAIAVGLVCNLILLALALLTLCEIVFDRNLGIDLAPLQLWYDYENTRPGRMAPNTALGFLLIASAALLAARVDSKGRALLVVVLTFMVLAIGSTGLVGYLLTPDLLFGWARSARMAVPTAIGMIACALSLGLGWARSDWYATRRFFREDEKIRLLGGSTVIVATITAGLTGFVLLQDGVVRSLEQSLEAIARDRRPWVDVIVRNREQQAKAAVGLAGFDQAAQLVLLTPSPRATDRLRDIGEQLVRHGFRGVAVEDVDGRVVQSIGSFSFEPEVFAALDASGGAALVWDKHFLLRHRLALTNGDRVIGGLLLDEDSPGLQDALFNVSSVGKTGEINACVRRDRMLVCFPGSAHAVPFIVAPSSNAPFPMERALDGGSGVIHAVDYLGANVVAAYMPLAPGLGMVLKQRTTEAYSTIRHALEGGIPILLAIAAAGAALLYWQISPLARSLWKSERLATENELKVRGIMDSTDDGILTIDGAGIVQDVNPATCRLFGRERAALVGTHFATLIPVTARTAQVKRLLRLIRGGSDAVGIAASNIEMLAQRADGSAFPVELMLNAVALAETRLFVGVLRDITRRKEEETKLATLAQYDPLTSLPNRALFIDRLGSALLRSARTNEAFAVIFLDLDGFKHVNDTYGHPVGDELLVRVGRRLLDTVRKSDTVARLAGDEFMVILERLAKPAVDAEDVVRKIVESMRQPFDIDGNELRITISAGVVIHRPDKGGSDVAELLRRADREMYAAKRSGKDAFSIALEGAMS